MERLSDTESLCHFPCYKLQLRQFSSWLNALAFGCEVHIVVHIVGHTMIHNVNKCSSRKRHADRSTSIVDVTSNQEHLQPLSLEHIRSQFGGRNLD